jgi:hypothetical protein
MKASYIKQTVGPASEPVSVAESKVWMRVSDDDQDSAIVDLIAMAREFCEDYTGLTAVQTTYLQVMDYFPVIGDDRTMLNSPVVQPIRNYWRPFLGDLEIPIMRSPLVEVSGIEYYNGSGVLTTLDASKYTVSTIRQPGRLSPAFGQSWPTAQDRPESVKITLSAGYADANAVPIRFKQAMRLIVAHHYEHRESVSELKLEEVPQSALALLEQLRIPWTW